MPNAGNSLVDRLLSAAVEKLLQARPQSLTGSEVASAAGIEEALARTVFATDADMTDAIGTFGAVRMTDYLSRQLIAQDVNDPRACLIAMGIAYVTWARNNSSLYRVISHQNLQPAQMSLTLRRYDESYRVLVERFMGETDGSRSIRPLIARCFIFGLADLVLDEHAVIWAPAGLPVEDMVTSAVETLVDALLAAQARPEPVGPAPARS